MKKPLWISIYFVLCSSTYVHAAPYPLGSMSCDDIGAFASQAMQWREDGVLYKEAKTRLDALRSDESVEKKNMRVVMQLAQRVRVAQGRLALCDLSGHVYEVFDMTGSLEFLPVFASRADALTHARA
jgi:hypothetical protein